MNPGTGKIRPASGRAEKRKKTTRPAARSANRKTSGRSVETHRRGLEKMVELRTGELAAANKQLAVEIKGRTIDGERLRLQAGQLENISDVVYAVDLKMRVTSWNRAAEKVYGRKEKDVLGKSIFEVVGPDAGHEMRAVLTRELLEKGPVSARIEHTTKEGASLVFDSITMIRRDAAGNAIGFLGVNRDITERDRAVGALRESEKRYRYLVEHVTAGIFRVDFTSGRFTEVNNELCKILGYTREEFLAMTAFDILDEEGKSRFAQRIRQAQSGVQPDESVEYGVLTKDGRHLWALVNSTFSMSGGRITGATVVTQDITERKNTELALRDSEARFKAIAEATPVGIGVVSASDATFLYVNPAYLKGFGYEEGEILGKGTPQIYWSNEERDRALAILKDKGSVAEYEVKLKRKDGTPFWGLSSVRPITYDGKPALLGAFVDITDRKIAEDKLKQASEELRRSNKELAFFNNAMVGRELRMIELKKEIDQLCRQFGQPLRYNYGGEGAAGSVESAQ